VAAYQKGNGSSMACVAASKMKNGAQTKKKNKQHQRLATAASAAA